MGIPQTIILNIKTNDDTILSGRLQFILPENISIDGDSELKTHQISSEKDDSIIVVLSNNEIHLPKAFRNTIWKIPIPLKSNTSVVNKLLSISCILSYEKFTKEAFSMRKSLEITFVQPFSVSHSISKFNDGYLLNILLKSNISGKNKIKNASLTNLSSAHWKLFHFTPFLLNELGQCSILFFLDKSSSKEAQGRNFDFSLECELQSGIELEYLQKTFTNSLKVDFPLEDYEITLEKRPLQASIGDFVDYDFTITSNSSSRELCYELLMDPTQWMLVGPLKNIFQLQEKEKKSFSLKLLPVGVGFLSLPVVKISESGISKNHFSQYQVLVYPPQSFLVPLSKK